MLPVRGRWTAYEVLSDVDKRRVYDQFGEDGLEQQAQRRNAPRNPFASFFGFGGGGGGEEEAGPERGPDVKISLRVRTCASQNI